MFDNAILKAIIPMAEKFIKNEDLTNGIKSYLDQFPLSRGEKKNSIICTIEQGKDGEQAFLCVVGMAYNQTLQHYYITKIKQQKPLVEAIKQILSYGKTSNKG